MKQCDHQRFGFDEGVFTPGSYLFPDNPHTDFKLVERKEGGKKTLINLDTGKTVSSYAQSSWYWKPSVALMNHPCASEPIEYWPNTPESRQAYGAHTYGPDVEAYILPTLADIMKTELPEDYEIHGESLWPFLTTDQAGHRDWIYAYKSDLQLIRGHKVLRDGYGKWWDVETILGDLISFPLIRDWAQASRAHRDERDRLKAILPRYDNYHSEHDPKVP